MPRFPNTNTILLADDDPFSCKLTEIALQECQSPQQLMSVRDGEELLDYLHRRGKYEEPSVAPMPGLILLDLNMPKKDGRETLQEIRNNPQFAHIPVVILTSSASRDDVSDSYERGANSFITKPGDFDELVRIMELLSTYWFNLVCLPLMDH